MARRSGFALIVVIVVILIVAILVLGIISFVSNNLALDAARSAEVAARAAAQAGIYWGIIDYKTDNKLSKVTSDSYLISNVASYKMGEDANLLLVDADKPLGILSTSLTNIGLANISLTQSVTISRVVVEWDFGGNITAVALGGAPGPNYSWIGSRTSPADITLAAPYTIAASGSYANNFFRFSSAIPLNAVISVTFYSSGDSSSRKALLYNNGRSGNREFSITATGKVKAGENTFKKTIEATYDAGVNKITSWNETDSHI